MAGASTHPEASRYRRHAAGVTSRALLHRLEKEDLIRRQPVRSRKRARAELEAGWAADEAAAAEEAAALIERLRGATDALQSSLGRLADLRLPELLGKIEGQQLRVRAAEVHLETAAEAARGLDFGAAGAAVEEAERELWLIGGPVVVALNQALGQASVGRELRARLQANLAERREAKVELETIRRTERGPAALEMAVRLHLLDAAGFELAAEVLGTQAPRQAAVGLGARVGRTGEVRVVPPHECETFADVGGLEEVKEQLRGTIGGLLERPEEAARYRLVQNGILFYGPPGTGKNLLSRALAGEYGLRYLRFSPASIASAYIHEAAANLRRIFELARDHRPCVLFLDEIDAIASDRGDQPSADHREVVTQLMICLEEYRAVSGLLIVAATNDIDRLDPGLREGRFDARIFVPLPDREARADVLRVHLETRGDAVDWESMDLPALAGRTTGFNGAALESLVQVAAQAALRRGSPIQQSDLQAAIRERGGKHRASFDDTMGWDDVVLADETREQLNEILNVFARPDLAETLGVRPPAGILLHGPPGVGKTTVAKAMAARVAASFYEQSAADLLSKWVGESEQRVAKLFTKARANRPSIIFIDEVDGLLRRRSAGSAAPWEERVIGQFLKELDQLGSGDGVLLIAATGRLDIIEPAFVGRRLVPVALDLPDGAMRLKLLQLHCRDVKLAKDVDLREAARATEGMSGADLRRIRDAAGMKALSRVAKNGSGRKPAAAAITMADVRAALQAQRRRTSLVQV